MLLMLGADILIVSLEWGSPTGIGLKLQEKLPRA